MIPKQNMMGFSADYSDVIVTYVLCQARLFLTALRWVWSIALSYNNMGIFTIQRPVYSGSSSSSSSSSLSAQEVRDSLPVTKYSELRQRLPDCGGGSRTCAVCLNELRGEDKVWELRNCCHVFHKRCLDGWLEHDEHKTCPLCRAPLLIMSSEPPCPAPSEPSWAVERIIYLFGDDLLST